MFFGYLFVSGVAVQTPRRCGDLPGCYGNLEFLHDRERPLKALAMLASGCAELDRQKYDEPLDYFAQVRDRKATPKSRSMGLLKNLPVS